jgi:hypothetical protein
MEYMTGYTAAEALGRPPLEVYGFHGNIYVQKSYFHYMAVAPPPLYVMMATCIPGFCVYLLLSLVFFV